MERCYFGDPLDYYKRWFLREACGSALRGLRVLPMSAEGFDDDFCRQYAALLGIEVSAVLKHTSFPDTRTGAERKQYFTLETVYEASDVFLDPNTGLHCRPCGLSPGKRPKNYVLLEDLAHLLPDAAERLVIIYDNSLGFGSALPESQAKLVALENAGYVAFTYCAPVSMVVVGRYSAISRMLDLERSLRDLAYLPPERILRTSSIETLRSG